MDEDVDAGDALARLEAALDRIAAGPRPVPRPLGAEPAGGEQGAPEVAERLDALIAQLRDALDRDSPDRNASASEG